MKRDFMVVEDEDEYDQVILSLAATEVSRQVEARLGLLIGSRSGSSSCSVECC